MEIGIDSFAAAMIDTDSGAGINSMESITQLLERIEHADQVGLDVFGIGEHHRKEFLDAAPVVILAAAAARTKRIRLTSAVTVLSAADPVRVFQNFATLDLNFSRPGRNGSWAWVIYRILPAIRPRLSGLRCACLQKSWTYY